MAISSSSFLFLRRVQAVFQDSKPFVYFFSALWVVNVGISFLVPIGSHSGPLSATGYCINIGIKPYVAASAFVPLAFDSLVFLAVSWKIITLHSLAEQETTWGAVFFSGRTLPHFVKAVFRGGQQYYLCAPSLSNMFRVWLANANVRVVTASQSGQIYWYLLLSSCPRSRRFTRPHLLFLISPLQAPWRAVFSETSGSASPKTRQLYQR